MRKYLLFLLFALTLYPYSLTELFERVKNNYYAYLSSKAQVESQKDQCLSASMRRFGSFSLQLQRANFNEAGNLPYSEYDLSLTAEFDPLGSGMWKSKASKNFYRASLFKHLSFERKLFYTLASLYYDYLFYSQRVKFLHQDLEWAEKQLKIAEESYKNGALPEIDYLRWKSERELTETKLEQAMNSFENLKASLSVLFGEVPVITGSLKENLPIENFEREMKKFVGSAPAISYYKSLEEAYNNDARAVLSVSIPKFVAGSQLNYYNGLFSNPRNWNAYLGISIGIIDPGMFSLYSSKRKMALSMKFMRENSQRQERAFFQRLINNYSTSKRKAEHIEKATSYLKTTLEKMQSAYGLRGINLNDLLLVKRDFIDQTLEYYRTLREANFYLSLIENLPEIGTLK